MSLFVRGVGIRSLTKCVGSPRLRGIKDVLFLASMAVSARRRLKPQALGTLSELAVTQSVPH